MRRDRITITLKKDLLEKIDQMIDKKKIRNRSHAIEFITNKYFQPNIKKAVILAGGPGTKLRPYTYEVPKSLLPVKGKPILEYLILLLKKGGIDEIIICTGYLGNKIKKYFGNGEKFGVKITYSQEKKPLETGGALNKVKKFVGDQPFLTIHGDILTNINFKKLIKFHHKQKTLATMVLTSIAQPNEFGQLKLYGTQLVGFYKKSSKRKIESFLVNCGIYVFEPEMFEYFPKDKKHFLLEDILQKLINERKICGFVYDGYWFDVGNPKKYEEAIKKFRYED